MKKILAGAALVAMAVAGTVSAQSDAPFAREIKARQGIMTYRALNLGLLGGMAKGEVEYDAAAAQKAADALLVSSTMDLSMLWPPGSDSTANPDTRALAAIWESGSDIGAKATALVEAATAMQAAAGVDLESLQGAMQAVGGACGGCHEAFRAPNN